MIPDVGTEMTFDRVASVLTSRYGLVSQRLARVPIGQGTVNYRVFCVDQEVFVKVYPDHTDLAGEREAIELSAIAGQHGVPVAATLRNCEGQTIDSSAGPPLSVWQWMPGQVITEGLSTEQYKQAGAALGRIHAAFAPLSASSGPAPQVTAWRSIDSAGLSATILRLTRRIEERIRAGVADAFDAVAACTLSERRSMVDQIPPLLADLPDLRAQVLHGDYSLVNLLYEHDQLTAVIDFCPPDPFLIAYDLGRVAFHPNTVTSDEDWMEAARTLISSCIEVNSVIPVADIRAAGRVALVQLLRSLYGVKQHYLKPGLFQDDLDQFWLLRHRAAKILFEYLAETDDLLQDLAEKAESR
ncbi:phosphotransferase [Frankia sp. Cpl3]|nr:phosphotransferase [Frankia sp. Cpl3]